ncbi:MAG: dCTP deaminase [Clostridium sp.]|uniref:dCTP deaminase n=1 Tax=Clostridium sp. TaxID=1506 RepID=UPI002911DB30|nr:dCTP deaminase [Clostridium sp.]MDU7339332.1 dCTP deaminase [Clostridium sp.]
MILSGQEIYKHIGSRIIIEPFKPSQLNPNSYNLTLHDELMVYDKYELDMKKPNDAHTVTIPSTGFLLKPGKLYLGQTAEYTRTDGFVPMLEGRSSVGRLGMCIHATAGFGDVGFAGFWTLEIFVVQPLVIYPGVEICQIYYHALDGDYTPYRSGKYQNNTGIQASMMYKDFKPVEIDQFKNGGVINA